MNPIELGKAIDTYGIPIITAVMLILVVGLVWYLIKRQTKREDKHDTIQKEERLFYRDLVKTDLKDLHKDSLLNVRLNRKSVKMQKLLVNQFTALAEYLNSHFNGCVDKVNFKDKVKK